MRLLLQGDEGSTDPITHDHISAAVAAGKCCERCVVAVAGVVRGAYIHFYKSGDKSTAAIRW